MSSILLRGRKMADESDVDSNGAVKLTGMQDSSMLLARFLSPNEEAFPGGGSPNCATSSPKGQAVLELIDGGGEFLRDGAVVEGSASPFSLIVTIVGELLGLVTRGCRLEDEIWREGSRQ